MHFTDLIHAVILGVVEGATEFLPISSTGHLILVGHWIGFVGSRAESFEVFIQLGAILAVVWEKRRAIAAVFTRWQSDVKERRLVVNLAIAFLPAAIVGFLAHDWIKAHLFSPLTVAWALIVGGVIMLLIERAKPRVRVEEMYAMGPRTALAIGLAQVLSLFPGVSRSGATIMGGVGVGLSRKAATEFSFFLAIPVMLAATMFDLLGGAATMTGGEIAMFAVGLVTAFLSALVVVKALLWFVARRSFVSFAWYRIGAGIVALYVFGGLPG
jgi:undecaprenyl-diphosphatase